MRYLSRSILLVTLILPLVGACGLPAQTGPLGLDSLARWLPGDLQLAFFLNLKPEGETGVAWAGIQNAIAANPEGKQTLDSLLSQFRAQDFGLGPYLVGPLANGVLNNTNYFIFQVNSQSGARDVLLLEDPGRTSWESEKYEGKTLYHSQKRTYYGRPEWLALTTFDGLLVLVSAYDRDPIDRLKTLVSLPEEQSLAAQPAWKSLREQLPPEPMGWGFFNFAAEMPGSPAAAADSLADEFGRQINALALAAIPEKQGMRIDIAASVALQEDAPAQIRNLLASPAVEPAIWPGLPADTALALTAHDASPLWPVLRDILSIDSLGMVRDLVGLDLEADLFAPGGPLSGDFALAVTPPLPDQPISQGLTAGQLLFLARGATQAQMDALQAAMEGRGAVLGAQQVAGLEVQTQTGTEPLGYALTFGFDTDLFFLGTSPGVVGASVAARREANGLITGPIFEAVMATMPSDLGFFLYVNRPSLTSLAQANMSQADYERSQVLVALKVFDAVALGFHLSAERLDGTLYFYIGE